MTQLIECVPNFSEGRDPEIIRQITDAIAAVEGVQLLDVDPGKATNRTVVTFVGAPEAVVEAAFQGIRQASLLIDMKAHSGEHPRMGATDVCPLVPVSGISMEETVEWAKRLAARVGEELSIPVYLYEEAASRPERRNLAIIRTGEYEALPEKLADPNWAPDFGPARFHARSGATVIGARDFLVAYNINLNTTSVRRANSIAFDVREQGRVLRDGDPVTGPVRTGEDGEPLRQPGACKAVKAIGWYIEEYGIAQVSMNLTDINVTPLHIAFEASCRSAEARGMRVTGSELVGMVPLRVLLDAGRYFLRRQQRSTGVSEEELLRIAVRSLGLDDLAPFDPRQKVIEYKLRETGGDPLLAMNLVQFANETASESPAPGGGSISAYVGALGASLAAMVANLSSHKRGWDEQWEFFSDWAERSQDIKKQLLALVDEDTRAFQAIMEAFGLPKGTPAEKATRSAAIEAATKRAIEAPLRTIELAMASFEPIREMVEKGNPNSVTDAGVGALCARAAVHGAGMNVLVNTTGLKDRGYAEAANQKAAQWMEQADALEREIIALVKVRLVQ
ncbi:MAG: glutamate formimidoyltransferase [Saprospiraceae bacterium]|nr:glutamate formimidoyltransferase [Saprospiraceae bacterium]